MDEGHYSQAIYHSKTYYEVVSLTICYNKDVFSLPKLYLQKLREIGLKGPCLSEESFINLPIDESNLKQVINAVKNHDIQNIKDVVLIGIGGSSLGTRAVYTALKKEKSLARIHFLDQINPGKVDEIAKSAKIWAARETAVVVISKSGTTLETIINHKLIQEKLPFYKECPLFFVTGEKTKNKGPEDIKKDRLEELFS